MFCSACGQQNSDDNNYCVKCGRKIISLPTDTLMNDKQGIRGMEMEKSNGSMIGLGIAGFIVGGLIAFLARPSAFLIGQLPFATVITRGAFLQGMEQLCVPLAQQSFNIMLIGAIIGSIAGMVIGYFIGMKKNI